MNTPDSAAADIGCGEQDHDEECLCDVVITEPVRVRYHLKDTLHAGVIQRALGINKIDSPAKAGELMEALGKAYDACRRYDGIADEVPDMYNNRRKILGLLQAGESIIDIPKLVGLDFVDVVRVLTAGRATKLWLWDEATWAEVEDAVRSGIGRKLLARRFGVEENQARTVLKWYGENSSHWVNTAGAAAS